MNYPSSCLKHIRVVRILIVITIIFIWANSAMPAEESNAVSGSLKAFIIKCLSPFFDTVWLEGHLALRKIAHLTEFGLLAVELLFLAYMNGQLKVHRIFVNFSTGLFVAFMDETIQSFSPGRTSKITDIWLDLTGFFVGTLISFLVLLLIKRNGLRKA